MKNLLLLVTLIVLSPTQCQTPALDATFSPELSGWTHIELGAGNYGQDGHTQKSQQMTVLMQLVQVSDKPNYVDRLDKEPTAPLEPQMQYAVLFATLDEMVKRRGPNGVFFVNDLYPEYAEYAAQQLRNHARTMNYGDVQVKALGGPYEEIKPSDVLRPYGKQRFDSVHLKNPEVSFYHYGIDGDHMVTSPEHRSKVRDLLQRLANLGNRGLYFFPIDVADYFIPDAEKAEFIDKGIFYLTTQDWQPVPYHFPEGQVMPATLGRVFLIENREIMENRPLS